MQLHFYKEAMLLYPELLILWRAFYWSTLYKEIFSYHQSVKNIPMALVKANVNHHCHLRVIIKFNVVDMVLFHSLILVPEKYVPHLRMTHVQHKAQMVLDCLMLITFCLYQHLQVSFSFSVSIH